MRSIFIHLVLITFFLCSLFHVDAKFLLEQSNVVVAASGDFHSDVTSRKLLRVIGKESPAVAATWTTETCSSDGIMVYQGATSPLPNGIPTYTVDILNTCTPPDGGASPGFTVSEVHLSCGWFSSARLVNPRVFRRLGYDDCLVNDGAALAPGDSVSFQYANSYPYHLRVSNVRCCS